MLRHTYLDFIRYLYCTCLTRPPDIWSQFRNLAGAMQRIKIDKIESQVAPAEEEADIHCLASTGLTPGGLTEPLYLICTRTVSNGNFIEILYDQNSCK